MDAEDVVQEAFLSLNETGMEQVRHPKAYLCRIVNNRCIDRLRSARHQREQYVGPWLPEPLVMQDEFGTDPYQHVLQKESISTAYLLLLQQLSWTERAVFLLREVLQYEYDEIADMVGKSSTNCRQIFRRAKAAIRPDPAGEETGEAGFLPMNAEQGEQRKQLSAVVEQFVQALAAADIGQLLKLMKVDAILHSDGGGKVCAAVRPIIGSANIMEFLSGLMKKLPDGFRYTLANVNGELGIVSYQFDQPLNVVSFDVKDGQIASVYLVVNPEKLRHLTVEHGG